MPDLRDHWGYPEGGAQKKGAGVHGEGAAARSMRPEGTAPFPQRRVIP